MKCCYIKVVGILKDEDIDTLKRIKLKSYSNRVMSKGNELNMYFFRAFYIAQAEMDNSMDELSKLQDQTIPIYEMISMHPDSFNFDTLTQLGLAYKNRHYYNEAYECLQPYPFYIEKIDCLMGLRKSDEAVNEANNYILMIGNSQSREKKFIICDLNNKFAQLYQESIYFEHAFQTFKCSTPLHLNGLFHFKRKEYEMAISALDGALLLSQQDEKFRFSYVCGLAEVNKIVRQMKHLKS